MKNQKLRTAMSKVPNETKKKVQQAVLEMSNQELRYEFDTQTYRHTMRIFVEGRRTDAFIIVPDDKDKRTVFYHDMKKYGITDQAIEACEAGIEKFDEMPF
jgi:hypothetical protein